MSTKKYPSTEEVEHNEKHSEPKHDRLEGSVKESESPNPEPEEYPVFKPLEGAEPAPWDNQAFYDKVRAAGFPTSSYGDAAFMQACYNLSIAVQPPPPDLPGGEKKHADKAY